MPVEKRFRRGFHDFRQLETVPADTVFLSTPILFSTQMILHGQCLHTDKKFFDIKI